LTGAIFVYRQFIAEAPAGTIRVKINQIQEVPVPSLLNENPLLCHEADAALGTTRCIEETNGDEYKNITTRNCCPWMDYAIIAAVHHEHHSFYDDTTNQLLRSDFCIYRDFALITIGVHDGRTEMA
jgi:hypothetical protein